MRFSVLVMLLVLVFIIGCSKNSLPYKSLSETKLSSPTGNVVAVQQTISPAVEESSSVPETSVQSGNASCHDTDYGKITTAAGKVTGVLDDGSEFEERDTCVGDVLYEYYCEGSKALFVKEVCDRGCKNGFCV